MTGLHAGLAIALIAIALAAILLGADFELLGARKGNATWWFIGIWLATSFLIGALPNTFIMWRAGLFITAISLVVTAAAGIVVAVPLAWSIAISLALLAALLLFSASKLQLRQRNLKKSEAKAPKDSAVVNWTRRISWWVLTVSMLEAFRMSHAGAGEAVKAIGCVGMLIVFFLMLPTLSLLNWYPRLSAMTWAFSAVLLAVLGWSSTNASVWIGSVLSLLCSGLMLRLNPNDTASDEVAQ